MRWERAAERWEKQTLARPSKVTKIMVTKPVRKLLFESKSKSLVF